MCTKQKTFSHSRIFLCIDRIFYCVKKSFGDERVFDFDLHLFGVGLAERVVGSKKNPISFYSCIFDILFDWSISVFIDIYYVVVMLPAPPPSSPLESAQLKQCFFRL